MKQFIVGETYYDRFYEITILGRTEKMITFKNWDGKIRRTKIRYYERDNCETLIPDRYSMCPIYDAHSIGKGQPIGYD